MTKLIKKIKTFFQNIDKKLTYCEWDEWVKNAKIKADIQKQDLKMRTATQTESPIYLVSRKLWQLKR